MGRSRPPPPLPPLGLGSRAPGHPPHAATRTVTATDPPTVARGSARRLHIVYDEEGPTLPGA